ncbi:MAG: histidine kinase [Acidimicrobiia bacterium]|nr:MAG: histidine kinase [Acidimicrobiia bacterium]
MPMKDAIRSALAEPRVPNPPERVWRDWALIAVLVPVSVAEGLLRGNLGWPAASLLLGVALVFTLLWRRTHPLAVIVAALGSVTILTAAAQLAGVTEPAVGLYTTAIMVLLPYSLLRWASGRDAAIGLVFITVAAVVNSVAAAFAGSTTDVILEPLIGSAIFFAFPAALGASVRYQTNSRLREIDHVKLSEREQLARELHDTVAHHVSAIVIQAQAGHIAAESQPGAAVEALEVIEQEASRTLAEMRTMIGALRDTEHADLAPQRGVEDIQRLAANVGTSPIVEVLLSGDLDELTASVDAAIYRLAQESITNAIRHAHNATHINVSVDGDVDSVRLSVSDDGDTVVTGRNPAGYGLIGMTERATLLGGTLDAGPSPNAGWTVTAVLPKSGASA